MTEILQVPSTSQDQLQDQYNDTIQFHGKWDMDGSRSVSCVSHVYTNTAQAGLHAVGPFYKHERSPALDQTDPPGGNLIWNILSKG